MRSTSAPLLTESLCSSGGGSYSQQFLENIWDYMFPLPLQLGAGHVIKFFSVGHEQKSLYRFQAWPIKISCMDPWTPFLFLCLHPRCIDILEEPKWEKPRSLVWFSLCSLLCLPHRSWVSSGELLPVCGCKVFICNEGISGSHLTRGSRKRYNMNLAHNKKTQKPASCVCL